MSLDRALDALDGAGTVTVEQEGGRAEIEVVEVGPIGARISKVRVVRDEPDRISDRAHGIAAALHTLPERLEAMEVSPGLGRAILRTVREELDGEGYFEVSVDEASAELRRVRLRDGERSAGEFSVTREQLGRLLGELEG